MDKILAFLKKLPTSLTVWVTVALGVISQLGPALAELQKLIGPGASTAMLVTAVAAFLARCRSIWTSSKPTAPTP